jgi:hypothetical protein
MRIAIIGSGIAGHGAAYRLTRHFGPGAVTLFEKEARPGGHSATVDIDYDGERIAVDTGFIVYNTLNYPLLTALFTELGVATHASDMGFSLSLDEGAFEWSGQDVNMLRALFAQRRNAVSPRFWRMLADMVRFNSRAIRALNAGALERKTLGEFVAACGLGADFRDNYILPMGAAIWSMSTSDVLGFPARSFVNFFNNHRLLHARRPKWRTVSGGSRAYVEKLIVASGHTTRYGDAVMRLARGRDGVTITTAAGHQAQFDTAIVATHSDQALALLADPSVEERAILGAIRYAENDVYLHRDPALMPRRRAAWAAWNVLRSSHQDERPVTVTYWMNRLQSISSAHPLFVTLNPAIAPRADYIFGRYSYAHPQYDHAAITAQEALPRIQGRGGVYFAGAWVGHGFHEDGLRSGFEAADRLIAGFEAERIRSLSAAE